MVTSWKQEHLILSLTSTCLVSGKEDSWSLDLAIALLILGRELTQRILTLLLILFSFPPSLWVYLSEAWNRSKSPYMICFHGPRSIIDTYEFEVELLAQTPTSMHGSKEVHQGYIYQRKDLRKLDAEAYIANAPCDNVFQESYEQVKTGLDTLRQGIDEKVQETWSARRSTTRSVARKNSIILSRTTE